MSNNIKVSVIVPVYKVPLKYLRECFDSLLAQTMQECEFIVVSDGAPEAECSVCEEYVQKDARFRFFRQEHAGVSATRNYGIDQAQGEYITFVDSDDWIDSSYCEEPYNYAKENESDIVLWEATNNLTGGKALANLFQFNQPTISAEALNEIYQNIIYNSSEKYHSVQLVCCKLFSRNLIQANKITYPTDIRISEDRIFNIQAYKKAQKISYLNKTLYHYRAHIQSTSHSYTPNAFFSYISFFNKLDEKLLNQNSKSVSMECVRSFFHSWDSCYFHPEYKKSIKERVHDIINISQSPEFQKYVLSVNLRLPTIQHIELFLLKKGIYIQLYIHALKAKFFPKS